jgi:hypothetical protein
MPRTYECGEIACKALDHGACCQQILQHSVGTNHPANELQQTGHEGTAAKRLLNFRGTETQHGLYEQPTITTAHSVLRRCVPLESIMLCDAPTVLQAFARATTCNTFQ